MMTFPSIDPNASLGAPSFGAPWEGGLPGVIFDMDGVLIDSGDAHFESWRRLGDELGVPISAEVFRNSFGMTNADLIPRLLGPRLLGEARDLADRKEAWFRRIIADSACALPGVIRLLSELSTAGVKLAVGSSGPRANVNFILDSLKAKAFFQAVLTGDDVIRGKPDPEVFLRAASAIHVSPHHCVVVEDAPAGVVAGKTAGMKVIAVTSTHCETQFARLPADTQPDWVVSTLHDVSLPGIQSLFLP